MIFTALHASKSVAVTTAANSDLVAAVSGKIIRVLAAALTVVGTATTLFKFQSDGTDLTGEMRQGSTKPLILPFSEAGWFETVAGEKLNIVFAGGARQIDGVIHYQEV